MTTNQIAYFKAKVEESHYKQSDAEAARHNREQENIAYGTLTENARHNVAVENENVRHNTQTEGIQYGALVEQQRHNIVGEGQTDFINQANVLYTASRTLDQDWNNYLNLKYGEIERVNKESLNDRLAVVRIPALTETQMVKSKSMHVMTQPAQNQINVYRQAAGIPTNVPKSAVTTKSSYNTASYKWGH